jgi:molecular chaperone GrpE
MTNSEQKPGAEDAQDSNSEEQVEQAVEATTEGETTTDAQEETPDLAAQLEAAQAEVEKFRDVALRAEAEMENVRRRATRDVENAHKFGQEKLIQNLLPVIDSLEKAIESAEQAGADEGANKAILEGVGLCLKMQLDVLAKEGLAVVDPNGEPFDPNLHQAMSMVENPDVEPNSVVAVIQKGYALNERLVRPAMVMVSKAPAAESGGGVDETV